jgi:hypothetical protein
MGKHGGGKRRGRKSSKQRGRKPRCTEHPVSRPVIPPPAAGKDWVDEARAGDLPPHHVRKAKSHASSDASSTTPNLPYIPRDEQSPKNALDFLDRQARRATKSDEDFKRTRRWQRSLFRGIALLISCASLGITGVIVAVGWAGLPPLTVVALGLGSALIVSRTAASIVKRRLARRPVDVGSTHAPGPTQTAPEADANS